MLKDQRKRPFITTICRPLFDDGTLGNGSPFSLCHRLILKDWPQSFIEQHLVHREALYAEADCLEFGNPDHFEVEPPLN